MCQLWIVDSSRFTLEVKQFVFKFRDVSKNMGPIEFLTYILLIFGGETIDTLHFREFSFAHNSQLRQVRSSSLSSYILRQKDDPV